MRKSKRHQIYKDMLELYENDYDITDFYMLFDDICLFMTKVVIEDLIELMQYERFWYPAPGREKHIKILKSCIKETQPVPSNLKIINWLKNLL